MTYAHLPDQGAGGPGNPCPRCGGSLYVLRNGAEIWGAGRRLPVGADLLACRGNRTFGGDESCCFVAVVGFKIESLAEYLRLEEQRVNPPPDANPRTSTAGERAPENLHAPVSGSSHPGRGVQ